MPHPSSRLARPWLTAMVSFLLAVHSWLSVSATLGLGVTTDETVHLTGGYSYWHLNDYRLHPENGNLPQRWGALPLLALKPRLEPTDVPVAWDRSHVWLMGQYFFFEAGNNTEFMLLLARSGMALWSVATGLLVFAWSRSLWGNRGGLLSLSLFAFSPTALAHGPLVTSDMCATFCLLAATGAWWRLLQAVTIPRLLVSLLATGAAALAKFSFVLLLPICGLLLAWRCLASSPWPTIKANVYRHPWSQAGLGLGLGIVHALFAWLVVWAAFGFRFEAFSPSTAPASAFFADWDRILPDGAAWTSYIQYCRSAKLLPEAFLQGFSYVMAASQERGAFLAGQYNSTGWWWFFPYAFLVKSTLAELVAAVAVLVLAVSQVQRLALTQWAAALHRFVPLLVFCSVYGAASITSNLNIGHRHILPLYPILFLFAGCLARTALGKRGSWAALVLAGSTLVESLSARPHYISFFNRLVGGPSEGWRHLVDSSLDWGQNVPRLAEWLRLHREAGERVYVSMFGSDDIFYHGIQAEELAPYFNFGRKRIWDDLHAGIYCISATMLQDVYSPFAGSWTSEREVSYQRLRDQIGTRAKLDSSSVPREPFNQGQLELLWVLERARFARLCNYLRTREPTAVIGHSIFVYRLSEQEIWGATESDLAHYIALMHSTTKRDAQGN